LDISESPAPFLSELLGKLYIRANRLPELNVMIEHRVLVESTTLAQHMIDTTDKLLFQTALDMLKRLDENELVVSTLLENNMVSSIVFLKLGIRSFRIHFSFRSPRIAGPFSIS
jgi:hypothetical protein